MNYTEIKNASYGYADRKDAETINMYDTFLRITESKINRHLKTLQATSRVSLASVDDQTFYGLPADFNGMRNIQIKGVEADGRASTVTAQFRTPAQINEASNITNYSNEIIYTLINDQIQIEPQLKSQTIEMMYYRKAPILTALLPTNWVGDDFPDCYIFGVLTEINSFVKDSETAMLWGARFTDALMEIKENDADTRWGSGDMLVMRTL